MPEICLLHCQQQQRAAVGHQPAQHCAEVAATQQRTDRACQSDSNSDRGNPDCRMIPNKVPVRNSRWSGTGTVIVVSAVRFCIMIWLPFCRTIMNSCWDIISHTFLPESTRNFGIDLPHCCIKLREGPRHSRHEGHNVEVAFQAPLDF